jgi:uncharacterized protein (DUF2147 family)
MAAAVIPFAVAVGLVPVAGAKSAKPKGNACTVLVTSAVPGGETVVLPSASQGEQWGSIHCGKKLGSGAEKQDFNSPDTGAVMGTFSSYLQTGTFHGSYSLTQQEGTFTGSFASVSYAGKLKIKGGSGAFKGAAGTGTETCTSQDGLHFTCKEKLTLTNS